MAKAKTGSKADRKKQDEELTNRILVIFGCSLMAMLVLMLLNRLARNVFVLVPLAYGCGYAAIALVVCALAGLAYTASLWKRTPENIWVGRALHLSVIALLVAGALAMIRINPYGSFPILYVSLIAIAFMYLIFHIYQKDFFAQAVVVCCSALMLYGFSRLLYSGRSVLVYAGYTTATLLLVGALWFAYYLSRHKGELWGVKLLASGANYKLMYTTFLLMNAALLTSLLLGVTVSFWCMIGVLGYLFVLAVYYTIKLM